MDEGRLGAHSQQLRRREKPGGTVQVVARVVVAEHQSVPQKQIKQRLRGLVVREAGLLAQSVERLCGGVDQPLDVVAIVGRVGANGICFRQRTVVDDGRDLRIVREEIVIEQIGKRGAAVAQALEQRDSDCLKIQVRAAR